MARLHGTDWSREKLRERVGDIAQLAGIERASLDDGPGRGIRTATLRTGTGLEAQVLLDRGMDLGRATFRGAALNFRSCVGDVHPSYYESAGIGWVRSFGGGLLATCGLSNVGVPCTDQGAEYGLHGRIGNTPAGNVAVSAAWQGDEYVFSVSGTLRETALFGANLALERTIRSQLGSNTIEISDVIRNEAFTDAPLMLLYHFNLGFPLVNAGSRLILAAKKSVARDADAEQGLASFASFEAPTPGYREQVFYHEMIPNKDGRVRVAMQSSGTPGVPAGLVIDYPHQQLPRLVQWKMMGQGTYVCGIEPANCLVGGRAAERAAGTLELLKPGAEKKVTIRLTVLETAQEVAAFEKELKAL